jgi:hypothetical protein
MYPYVHEHTSTETLQQIDKILDEVRDDVKNNGVDLELFKKVYGNDNMLLSVEEPKVEISFNMSELFTTAYDMKVKCRIDGRKYRKKFTAKFMYYALSKSSSVTINALSRILAEVDDSRFFRNMRNFWISKNEYKQGLIRAALINQNITDEVRLWLTLQ